MGHDRYSKTSQAKTSLRGTPRHKRLCLRPLWQDPQKLLRSARSAQPRPHSWMWSSRAAPRETSMTPQALHIGEITTRRQRVGWSDGSVTNYMSTLSTHAVQTSQLQERIQNSRAWNIRRELGIWGNQNRTGQVGTSIFGTIYTIWLWSSRPSRHRGNIYWLRQQTFWGILWQWRWQTPRDDLPTRPTQLQLMWLQESHVRVDNIREHRIQWSIEASF